MEGKGDQFTIDTTDTDTHNFRRNVSPVSTSFTLSATQDSSHAPSASTLGAPFSTAAPAPALTTHRIDEALIDGDNLPPQPSPHSSAESVDDNDQEPNLSPDPGYRQQSPPPRYPASEAETSASTPTSLVPCRTAPPPFSSLFVAPPPPASSAAADTHDLFASDLAESGSHEKPSAPAYEPPAASGSSGDNNVVEETKRSLPQDTKAEGSSSNKDDDAEPPPAYSEEDISSPIRTFTYIMAAAGGASSIITQVQQGGPPISTLGDVGADETISMDLRYVSSAWRM